MYKNLGMHYVWDVAGNISASAQCRFPMMRDAINKLLTDAPKNIRNGILGSLVKILQPANIYKTWTIKKEGEIVYEVYENPFSFQFAFVKDLSLGNIKKKELPLKVQ